MDIDYFFPWVNPLDPVWQAQYNKYSKESYDTARFRDWGTLKYLFRSLAYNMPWLHRVHLIVSTVSQVPSWLNTKTVNIIPHGAYIPDIYLPVFNSNAIEMFYYNLPWLSDYAIYGNDDTFAINPAQPSDFFTADGRPKIAYTERKKVKSAFLKTVKRTYDMVKNNIDPRLYRDCGLDPKFLSSSSTYIKPCHIAQPFVKADIAKVYQANEKAILRSVTRFRDNDRNVNQYMYTDYEVLSGKAVKVELDDIGGYTGFADNTPMEMVQMITHPKEKWRWLCINDTDAYDDRSVDIVKRALERKFLEKCKYEI